MKMDMSAKPIGEGMEKSNEGTYDQEHLDCMLKNFIEAKKIEQDPVLLTTLKDYALSKNKMIQDLFDNVKNPGKVKSLKDLKTKYDSLNQESMKKPSIEIEIGSEDDSEAED